MSISSTLIRPFVGPARVSAGPGASQSIGSELAAAGVQGSDGEVLLVGDRAVLELGLAGAATGALLAAGFSVQQCPAIDGEPTPEMVRALLPTEPHGRVAAVVAVGGGSALDAAKLLALACANDIDLSAGLTPDADVRPGPLMLAVPTTAGTGAEATAVAMLWHQGSKRMFVHPHLVPRIAVLDPDLLSQLPPAVTAAGGLDAISHAVESLLSTFRTPLSEQAAKAALQLLGGSVQQAYASGAPQARYGTLLGAYQAGLALNASVVLGHSLAYVIAARAKLPHGVSCAMALPYCLAHARPAREREIAEIAQILCDDRDATAEDLLRWLLDANAEMGIPASLAALGIEADALAEMASECVQRYPRPNHPVPIEAEDLERLLESFHAGDALGAWNAAAGSLA